MPLRNVASSQSIGRPNRASDRKSEVRSTEELFQELLARGLKGRGTKKPDQLAGLSRLKVQAS